MQGAGLGPPFYPGPRTADLVYPPGGKVRNLLIANVGNDGQNW